MLRSLHRLPGLILSVALAVLALSGALLSVLPALEKAVTPTGDRALTVATLAGRVLANYPQVAEIAQSRAGRITALVMTDSGPQNLVIDPATGQGIASAAESGFALWMTDLHRAFLLGDGGQMTAGVLAAVMAVMAISGIGLILRRVGGWRRIFAPLKGPLAGRIHVWLARLAVPGLLFSAVTAVFMSLVTFGVVSTGAADLGFPPAPSGLPRAVASQITALHHMTLAGFRDLSFPFPGDDSGIYTVETIHGAGYVDAGSGLIVGWQPNSAVARAYDMILRLHTGQGAWFLGMILGLSALAVPAMAISGTASWWIAHRGRPRIRRNLTLTRAETIILVGSETGTTWGFAATLHKALTEAGQAVHTTALSRYDPAVANRAAHVIALAATYGDGEPPASAKGFLERLQSLALAPTSKLAIIGFGDSQFAGYCAYANEIERAASKVGWPMLAPMHRIDRQSAQAFAAAGRVIGHAMGLSLELVHRPVVPRSRDFSLMSRRDYGHEVQAPVSILRFALPKCRGIGLRQPGLHFRAGDLLGILPAGSDLPRYYSLASDSRDGYAEICVSRTQGGLCSGQLLALEAGDSMRAFVRRNPSFRPARGKAPVILVGAGSGIGPLAGFVRRNRKGRPFHMFFGLRHPDSDFLYEQELAGWRANGQLATLTTAASRDGARLYVQDAIRRDAARLATLIVGGAQVLVCGGRDMGAGVRAAFDEILTPFGLTPALLKAQGRYREDVY